MVTSNSQLSRYGAMSRVLPKLAISGRAFFVLNASNSQTWASELQNTLPVDQKGVVRLFTTIAQAVAQCTAGRGDVIYVLPNHSENISSATALNINVAGVSIVGLGSGNNRPTITVDTGTTSLITISADNVSIENVIIDGTGFDAIAKVVSITGAGASILGCKFILAGATNQATLGILTTAAAIDLTIKDCLFYGTSDAGTTSAIRLVGTTNTLIENNIFIGAYSSGVGAIENITTDCVNLVVKGNLIQNLTASNTKAMTFTSGTTGMISNNRMQILSGTAPITGAAISWVGGNYYAAAVATAGTLI